MNIYLYDDKPFWLYRKNSNDFEMTEEYQTQVTISGGKTSLIKTITLKETLELLLEGEYDTNNIKSQPKRTALNNAIHNWRTHDCAQGESLGYKNFNMAYIGLDSRIWHSGRNNGQYQDHRTLYNNTASNQHLTFTVIDPTTLYHNFNSRYTFHLFLQVIEHEIQLKFSDD